MADIRSYAPASRALGPRPGFALIVARRGRRRASPEGRLRADARAPWTRCREHPRIVDRMEPWWRHAGCEPAQERARSLALGHSGSMSTATVPSA